jgi:hypothetical protein
MNLLPFANTTENMLFGFKQKPNSRPQKLAETGLQDPV